MSTGNSCGDATRRDVEKGPMQSVQECRIKFDNLETHDASNIAEKKAAVENELYGSLKLGTRQQKEETARGVTCERLRFLDDVHKTTSLIMSVSIGCISLKIACPSEEALQKLKEAIENQTLQKSFRETYLTESFMKKHGIKSVDVKMNLVAVDETQKEKESPEDKQPEQMQSMGGAHAELRAIPAIPSNKERLIRQHQRIVDDLKIDALFISHFVEAKVFNAYNVEDIMEIKNKHDRNRKFTGILPTRGPEGYPLFIRTLVQTAQVELAKAVDPVLTEQFCEELGFEF